MTMTRKAAKVEAELDRYLNTLHQLGLVPERLHLTPAQYEFIKPHTVHGTYRGVQVYVSGQPV